MNLTSAPGSAYIGASSFATPTSSSSSFYLLSLGTNRAVVCPPNKLVELDSKLVSEGLPKRPPADGFPKSDPAGAPPKRLLPSAGFTPPNNPPGFYSSAGLAAPNNPPAYWGSAGFAPPKREEAVLFSPLDALPNRGLSVFIAPNRFYCFGGSTA